MEPNAAIVQMSINYESRIFELTQRIQQLEKALLEAQHALQLAAAKPRRKTTTS